MGKSRRSGKASKRQGAGRRAARSAGAASASTLRHGIYGGLVVVALVAAVYGRAAGFELTKSDDVVLVNDDAAFLADPGNIPKAFARRFLEGGGAGESYYRPLVTMSLMWDAALGETDPTAFHVTNVVLHALVCVVALFFLRRLLGSVWLATAVVALFAVHPALTSAVVWIPGRIDMLLALFGLLSLLSLLRWLDGGRRGWSGLWQHGAFWLAALLCKETAVVIPAVGACYLLLDKEHRPALRQPRLWFVWGAALVPWIIVWLSVCGGSAGQPLLGSRLVRVLTNAPALLMNLGKIVFPYRLSVLANMQDTSWVAGAVAVVVLGGVAAWLRGRDRSLMLWGCVWALLFLVPTLVVADNLILECRLYAPALGMLIAAAALVRQLLPHLSMPAARYGAGTVYGIILLLGVVGTWRYSQSFANPQVFAQQAVDTSPQLALAHLYRGTVLHRAEDFAEAESHYRRALELAPDQPIVHNNLSVLLMRRRVWAEAETHLLHELRINGGYSRAHHNLGLLLSQTGRVPQAMESFKRAVAINPADLESLGRLYSYYAQRGEAAEATVYRRQMEQMGLSFTVPPSGVALPSRR